MQAAAAAAAAWASESFTQKSRRSAPLCQLRGAQLREARRRRSYARVRMQQVVRESPLLIFASSHLSRLRCWAWPRAARATPGAPSSCAALTWRGARSARSASAPLPLSFAGGEQGALRGLLLHAQPQVPLDTRGAVTDGTGAESGAVPFLHPSLRPSQAAFNEERKAGAPRPGESLQSCAAQARFVAWWIHPELCPGSPAEQLSTTLHDSPPRPARPDAASLVPALAPRKRCALRSASERGQDQPLWRERKMRKSEDFRRRQFSATC